jgi:hypothetical protein
MFTTWVYIYESTPLPASAYTPWCYLQTVTYKLHTPLRICVIPYSVLPYSRTPYSRIITCFRTITDPSVKYGQQIAEQQMEEMIGDLHQERNWQSRSWLQGQPSRPVTCTHCLMRLEHHYIVGQHFQSLEHPWRLWISKHHMGGATWAWMQYWV